MKLTRRSRWIIIVILLTVISALVFTQFDSVRAIYSGTHALMVLLRVETEIMQKTPAGQYYESLFWKHNDELLRIMDTHPENNDEYLRVTLMFIPGLDALVNGEGHTVQITAEQVESLKAQLNWHASVGSPELRADIQRELQRFPLDQFVGMTMSEALAFINSTWTPDPDLAQTLVSDSGGKWAYYVHDGVYLEYPSSYYLQLSESEKDYIYFVPSIGSPEQWLPCVMKVKVWTVPAAENDIVDVRSWFSPENITWDSVIQNTEFQGVEFIRSLPNEPITDMHAFLYNQENQLAVDIWVFADLNPRNENLQLAESVDYSEMIQQRYEYFQHMIDNIRIQTPTTPTR